MNILWLGEAGCHDRGLVGGKAAYLSQLAADHPVPPGFCLPATTGSLAELTAAYAELAARSARPEPPVAVRSSAVDEDGAGASFAGQHETYLNITGPDAVAEAIARCRASASAPRALAYRRVHGLPAPQARVAVLVQQLVVADVSAVAFSANPVTGDRDQVVITASWGLGESIVGGTVTPDTYHLGKPGLAITRTEIATKERMTVAIPGGTREVAIPRALRTRPALSPEQVVDVGRLALRLEAQFGWPVDIECACAAGRLYLLQCRPITTLNAGSAAA
ncbi:MAG TPA: PEP/pyruvate-binding domain-containing protein [Thermomicrobiales bacterium]|nr:PEP/pyruvate-binding domain-containing protein [Thermomicrobiales bacterium]